MTSPGTQRSKVTLSDRYLTLDTSNAWTQTSVLVLFCVSNCATVARQQSSCLGPDAPLLATHVEHVNHLIPALRQQPPITPLCHLSPLHIHESLCLQALDWLLMNK